MKKLLWLVSSLFLPITPAWSLPLPALPSLPETAETVARQLTETPLSSVSSLSLRTLAVRDIREEKTLAHWPLSDQLERAIVASLARKRPSFAILNQGELGALNSGTDAVLTGSFTRDHEGVTLSLRLEDPQGKKTFRLLEPIRFLMPDGALPEQGIGKLILDIDPPDALVFVDGKPMGKGAMILPLPFGRHLLTVAQDGFKPYDEPLMVRGVTQATVRLQRKGSVLLDANFPASVRVDGIEKGQTPLTLDLSGKHRILFSKPGFRPIEQEVDVAQGQVVRAALVRLPGKLLVTADVPGAEIQLDGTLLGKAPLLVPEVAAGAHQLKVFAVGFAPFEQDLSLGSEQVLSVRATLASGEEEGRTTVLLAASSSREDKELLALLKERIGSHPELAIDESAPFEGPDPLMIQKVARSQRARRVLLLGVDRVEPFHRLFGLWPQRSRMDAVLKGYSAKGAPIDECDFSVEGDEPWGLGEAASERKILQERLVPKVLEHLTGETLERSSPESHPLRNNASLLYSNERLHLGLGVERRIHPFFELGLGYQYYNALGADLSGGTTLAMEGPGASLVYGMGQSHQARADFLLRLNPGQESRNGSAFQGPRWVPYLGMGYRSRYSRYEVFGAGSKQSEGHFDRWYQRGVSLLGVKLQLGGMLFRGEAEIPIVAEAEDGDTHYTFGTGFLF